MSEHLCWVKKKNLQLTEGLECFKLYFDFQVNTQMIYMLSHLVWGLQFQVSPSTL